MKQWPESAHFVLPLVLPFASLLAWSGSAAPSPAPAPEQRWLESRFTGWSERTTGERVLDGNQLDFLIDGTEFYPVRLDLIRKATRSIDLVTFLWCDDEAGLTVARELAAAARRHVRVRVIIDFFNTKPHEQAYKIMEDAGIQVMVYNPLYWGLDRVNEHAVHEKIMITDGEVALSGGANVCDEYMIGGDRGLWHDLEVKIKGPSVPRIQERFDETWNWMARTDLNARFRSSARVADLMNMPLVRPKYTRYKDPTPSSGEVSGPSRAMFLWQQSYMRPSDGEHYKQFSAGLIRQAKRKIVAYLPYLIPPKEFRDALLEQARAGLDVTIITNSPETNDVSLAVALATAYTGPLLAAGAKVREYLPRTLHAKAILIDDSVVSIGSHNYTNRGFQWGGEANILTGDQAVVAKFRAMVERDLPDTREVTREVVKARTDSLSEQLQTVVAGIVRGLL